MELSIDTSTRYASVAISRDGESVAQLSWRAEQNHSVELVPALRRLMHRSNVAMGQVEAIFVAKGPGGFSALRVGMSMAKAVAMAQSIPLVAVGTLDIEARPHLELGLPVCALIDAGKRMVYAANFDAAVDGTSDACCRVETHESLLSSADSRTLYCGEGVASVADLLRQTLGTESVIIDTPPPTRRPEVLAQLGYRRLQANETDDPDTLKPIYIRGSQFEVAHRTHNAG